MLPHGKLARVLSSGLRNGEQQRLFWVASATPGLRSIVGLLFSSRCEYKAVDGERGLRLNCQIFADVRHGLWRDD